MKQISLVVSLLALVVSGIALYRQSAVPVTQPAASDSSAVKVNGENSHFKIAYFEMDSIENNYQYVKDSYNQVKSKEQAINNELSAIERGYQKKIAEWQKKGADMSQAESEQVQREYAQMQQSYQNRKMNLEQELNDLRNKKLRDIQSKIEEYLKEYNKNKGFSFIFSYEPALFIYYKDSALNITNDLLSGLNEEYQKGQDKKK